MLIDTHCHLDFYWVAKKRNFNPERLALGVRETR